MIIYSIVPYEIIFSNNDEKEKENKTINLIYKGEIVEAIKEENEYTIKRLISSNPKKYLNQEFSPNQKIKIN